jgi:hypothetical protein
MCHPGSASGPAETNVPRTLAVAVCILAFAGSAAAEVVRFQIDRRTDVLGGRAFGKAGPYELLEGRIAFEFDPASPQNRAIVDFTIAPRNAAGRVEAESDVLVLQAKNPAQRRGVAIVEVSNRGRKAAFQYFNLADERSPDPKVAADFGDGFLMDEGLTIVLLGWQFDVQGAKALGMRVPVVKGSGDPITGLVRSDWAIDRPQKDLILGHMGHWNYAPVNPQDPESQLSVRTSREGKRTIVPRAEWQFVKSPKATEFDSVHLNSGFESGKIYELVYRAQDPRLVGLGLLAVRDVVSYAKYNAASEFPVRKGIAFGFSQTGRFLRHFLYENLNTDEAGRQAYDGMLIQVAGAGRGSFNHRFAQPSRDATPYVSIFYPTDLFPFTSRVTRDAVSGAEGGLLTRQRPDHMPLIFQTNTSYEYWGRTNSLIHTTPDGLADVPPAANERLYLFAGAQHMIQWLTPPADARMAGTPAYRGNEVDFRLTFRALTMHMVRWVADGIEPPPSRYPRIADGTLVPPAAVAFPAIPGVKVPRMAHVAYRADYGPDFTTKGIITKEPPEIGPPFPALVPQVDGFGNDLGGIRPYELRAPLATNTAWNLRDAPWNTGAHAATGEDALTSYLGTFVPFPRTEAERRATGDPRPSIEAVYGTKATYLARVREAAAALVSEGFLLQRDLPLVEARAASHWDWAMSRPASASPAPSGASGAPSAPGVAR